MGLFSKFSAWNLVSIGWYNSPSSRLTKRRRTYHYKNANNIFQVVPIRGWLVYQSAAVKKVSKSVPEAWALAAGREGWTCSQLVMNVFCDSYSGVRCYTIRDSQVKEFFHPDFSHIFMWIASIIHRWPPWTVVFRIKLLPSYVSFVRTGDRTLPIVAEYVSSLQASLSVITNYELQTNFRKWPSIKF